MVRELSTVTDVIEVLGGEGGMSAGRAELMRLTGKSTQYVTNWLAAGRLPTWTIWTISDELERLGFAASPILWGLPEKPAPKTEAHA